MSETIQAFDSSTQDANGKAITATQDGIKRRLDVSSTISVDGNQVSPSNPLPTNNVTEQIVSLSDETIEALKHDYEEIQYTRDIANATQTNDAGATEEVRIVTVGGVDEGSNTYVAAKFSGQNLKTFDQQVFSKLPTLGNQSWVNSSPVVMADNLALNYSYVTPAIGKELLTGGTAATSWSDARAYNAMILTYFSTTSVGNFLIEGTNDPNDTTGVVLPSVIVGSAGTVASNGTLTFLTSRTTIQIRIPTRYVRIRMTTDATGTVTIFPYFKQIDLQHNTVVMNGGTLTGITAANLTGSAATDIGNATITTSPANLNATQSNVQAVSFSYNVSATSGSGQFLDLQIWETIDGTNYYPIYHFPRITAIGIYTTPALKVTGTGIQYRRTIGGTTPSFTQSLTRVFRSQDGRIIRNFFERGLTGNAVANGTVYNVEGCRTLNFSQSSAAGALSAPIFTCRGSDDGVNFYDLGTLTAAASTNTYIQIDVTFKFVRVDCTTAGTSASINYLNIRGQE